MGIINNPQVEKIFMIDPIITHRRDPEKITMTAMTTDSQEPG